jgi:hypothetical protein
VQGLHGVKNCSVALVEKIIATDYIANFNQSVGIYQYAA